MHNVCLGVTQKLLNCWISENFRVRQSCRTVNVLSEKLVELRSFTPVEINRKPRSLNHLARFKATEFRNFLLYFVPVILADVVDIAIYKHFIMLLHSAITILCCQKHLTAIDVDFVSTLLNTFISHATHLYGLEFLIYNVHNLTHLSEDVRLFGPLDTFSAFPFENYLGYLKRLVTSPYKPLQQVYRKLKQSKFPSVEHCNSSSSSSKHEIEHNFGPLLSNHGKQYKKLNCKDF